MRLFVDYMNQFMLLLPLKTVIKCSVAVVAFLRHFSLKNQFMIFLASQLSKQLLVNAYMILYCFVVIKVAHSITSDPLTLGII